MMVCPNCGGLRPETGQCPHCNAWLLGEKPPVVDPGEIPIGRHKGVLGYLELQRAVLTIKNCVAETAISYNQLVTVYFREGTRGRSGSLTVRWLGNQYLPLPVNENRVDITSVYFRNKDTREFYRLYNFLKTVAERNHIETISFANRQAQLESQGILYCPRCLSTQISVQKKGFNMVRGVSGNNLVPGLGMLAGTVGANKLVRSCPYCGHVW